ncbi:MAG: PROTEIN ERFK/SRFK [uncultured Sphingomonadaceae bacterium]|uniref:PROTEIN ERFK/SRFK n=1 Tax=uncultured Sphingomonadaceae bacterium TaxID=169976 RepID=A0A6J4TC97_9SPHN|nr:MAG: PROTEIN ERFK/SRFK [uncultured Sphingomonadaceae bacterium]
MTLFSALPSTATALGVALVLALAPAPVRAAQPGAVPVADVPSPPRGAFAAPRRERTFAAQVMLDRLRFSPGAIDGRPGGNTTKAVRAFQQARALPVDGRIDEELVAQLRAAAPGPVLRRYKIAQPDVSGPFAPRIPDGLAAQAELERLAYTGPVELLAEKFHMTRAVLRALNPDADFAVAGTEIVVAATRDGGLPGQVLRIEVDKAAGAVRAYAEDGELLAAYPATIGSRSLPSPSGQTEVRAVAPDPAYYFDPKRLSWGPDRRLTIAPGPNNPVGAAWIDLAKDGYGIHGTPEPRLIGKTASHGCVRLTNWDVEELAAAVERGAAVAFVGG